MDIRTFASLLILFIGIIATFVTLKWDVKDLIRRMLKIERIAYPEDSDNRVLTLREHKDLCEHNESAFCSKIDEIKKRLDKMDDNREKNIERIDIKFEGLLTAITRVEAKIGG